LISATLAAYTMMWCTTARLPGLASAACTQTSSLKLVGTMKYW